MGTLPSALGLFFCAIISTLIVCVVIFTHFLVVFSLLPANVAGTNPLGKFFL